MRPFFSKILRAKRSFLMAPSWFQFLTDGNIVSSKAMRGPNSSLCCPTLDSVLGTSTLPFLVFASRRFHTAAM